MKGGAILVQLELKYYQLNRTLHPKLVPYDYPAVEYNINSFLSTCNACSEVPSVWRTTYFDLLWTKLILAPLGMPK